MPAEPTDRTIHQHPLAYLLGLEGVALLRAFAGEHDRAFTEARIAEVRELLDRADELGPGVDVPPCRSPTATTAGRRRTTARTTAASRCGTTSSPRCSMP